MAHMTYRTYRIVAILLAIILSTGVFFVWQKISFEKSPTLQEAAMMGEVATHKLLVQIESFKGKMEDASGRYERGDIVLIFPADHQFSLAEKEGFLIIRMDLTPKQAEILIRSLEEEKTFLQEIKSFGSEASDPEEAPKTLKRRKFAVDLAKIGIDPGEQKGREIEGQIFKWDIVAEKQ